MLRIPGRDPRDVFDVPVRLHAHPYAAAALARSWQRGRWYRRAFFAVVTLGVSKTAGFALSTDPLDNLPAQFDAGWYGVALDGYQWDQQFGRQRNIAFFQRCRC